MLSPYVIVTIQFTLGLIIFGTVCREYVLGWLQRSDVFVAIAPVLLFQGFRFLGLTMLAPDQVAAGQDMDAIEVIAYGDLAGTLEEGIGVMWITFGLIAPLLVLSHGYVLYALIKRRDEFSISVA